jgi:hypothetical protein
MCKSSLCTFWVWNERISIHLNSSISVPALAPIVCHNGNVDNLQNTGTFHFGNQNRDERASDVIGDESAPACYIGLSSRCRITTSFRQTNWSNVRRILEEDQIDHWFKQTKLYILIGIWILQNKNFLLPEQVCQVWERRHRIDRPPDWTWSLGERRPWPRGTFEEGEARCESAACTHPTSP